MEWKGDCDRGTPYKNGKRQQLLVRNLGLLQLEQNQDEPMKGKISHAPLPEWQVNVCRLHFNPKPSWLLLRLYLILS